MANTPAEGTTIRRFLELLEAAQLLNAADWAAVQAQLPEAKRDQDAAEVARKLVSQHALTKHQAASLYQQRPKNLGIGPYIFLDRLGTGGSGSVYKAKHRKTEAVVAVKVLNLSGSRSPEALKRFQREAETAARLNHPNIVRALETGEAGGQYYTAMELVEGTDLSTYIKKQGPLNFEQAAQCIVTTARALAYAHEQGIIHRDIKPANLMLCNDGTLKVLDMGLARLQDPASTGNDQAAEGLTQTGQVMGTVDYMAPEQALHTRLADARADVYSLGCTFYRLATGDIPYDADSMVAKILAHREMPIPSLQKKNPKAPAAADIVLQRMLAKKPEDRYQSMNELADELERCTQGLAIAPLTPPVNLPTALANTPDPDSHSNSLTIGVSPVESGVGSRSKGKSKGRKTPMWVPLTVGAVVLLAGGIGWSLIQSDMLAQNEPEFEKAIAPKPDEPKPSGTATTTVATPTNGLTPLPASTAASPTPTRLPPSNRPPVVAVAAATKPIDFSGGVLPSTPPSNSTTPANVASSPTAPSTDTTPRGGPGYTNERDFAAWCFEQGYRVAVYYPAIPTFSQTVTSLTELPAGEFAVVSVYFTTSSRPLTRASLAKIATAPFVTALYINNANNVEPGAWQELAPMQRLYSCSITRSSFNDADVAALRSLSQLRQIDLSYTQVTDAGLDALSSLPNLTFLNLSGLPITEAGINKLAAYPKLIRVHLGNTPITDAAVPALSRLTNLSSINLASTQVTLQGKQQLTAALPKCDVYSTTWYSVGAPRPSAAAIAAAATAPSSTTTVATTAPSTGGLMGVPQPTSPFTPPAAAPAKQPIPTDDKLAESLKLIREELLKDEYAKAKKPEERVALGRELYGQALGLKDDPVGLYAMLREARDLAAEGGDITLATSVCSNAAAAFELDPLDWLADGCEAVSKKPQARPIAKSIAEGLMPKVEEAAQVEHFETAERLLELALAAARKSLDPNLPKQMVERGKQLAIEKKQFDVLADARKTLADKPDDAAANLLLGKHECFTQGKWDVGLPLLAKSSDPILKGLAEKSIVTPLSTNDMADLGDQWWTQSEKTQKQVQKEYMLGALHWYEKASLQLTGLQRTRVDKRIADARVFLGDAIPQPKGAFTSLPPATAVGQPMTPPGNPGNLATTAGLSDDHRKLIALIFSRNGGVAIEVPSPSGNGTYGYTIYNDVDLARYSGRITGIAGAHYYGSRGSQVGANDMRALAAAGGALIKRIYFEEQSQANEILGALTGFPNLDMLSIRNCPLVTDAGLAAFPRNGRLSNLTLAGTGITGVGFRNLSQFNVTYLHLEQSRIDDAGLAGIGSMMNVRYLYLDETGVTDGGLSQLAGMQNLTSLHLSKTRVTGAGLGALLNLPNLTGIYLNDAPLSDAGLTMLGRFVQLSYLHLDNTPITDAGLTRLTNLRSLTTLYISGCQRVTDASVASLTRLSGLTYLAVRGTPLSLNAVQALRTQLPRCNVSN